MVPVISVHHVWSVLKYLKLHIAVLTVCRVRNQCKQVCICKYNSCYHTNAKRIWLHKYAKHRLLHTHQCKTQVLRTHVHKCKQTAAQKKQTTNSCTCTNAKQSVTLRLMQKYMAVYKCKTSTCTFTNHANTDGCTNHRCQHTHTLMLNTAAHNTNTNNRWLHTQMQKATLKCKTQMLALTQMQNKQLYTNAHRCTLTNLAHKCSPQTHANHRWLHRHKCKPQMTNTQMQTTDSCTY